MGSGTRREGRVMIKDIKVRQANTGMFYATCYSTKTGNITQWGLTPNRASKRLHDFVVNVLKEKWPAIARAKGK